MKQTFFFFFFLFFSFLAHDKRENPIFSGNDINDWKFRTDKTIQDDQNPHFSNSFSIQKKSRVTSLDNSPSLQSWPFRLQSKENNVVVSAFRLREFLLHSRKKNLKRPLFKNTSWGSHNRRFNRSRG